MTSFSFSIGDLLVILLCTIMAGEADAFVLLCVSI